MDVTPLSWEGFIGSGLCFFKNCIFINSMFCRDCNDLLVEWCMSGSHTRRSAVQIPSRPQLSVSETCPVTACQGYLLSQKGPGEQILKQRTQEKGAQRNDHPLGLMKMRHPGFDILSCPPISQPRVPRGEQVVTLHCTRFTL